MEALEDVEYAVEIITYLTLKQQKVIEPILRKFPNQIHTIFYQLASWYSTHYSGPSELLIKLARKYNFDWDSLPLCTFSHTFTKRLIDLKLITIGRYLTTAIHHGIKLQSLDEVFVYWDDPFGLYGALMNFISSTSRVFCVSPQYDCFREPYIIYINYIKECRQYVIDYVRRQTTY